MDTPFLNDTFGSLVSFVFFWSTKKNHKLSFFVEDHPMNIPTDFVITLICPLDSEKIKI